MLDRRGLMGAIAGLSGAAFAAPRMAASDLPLPPASAREARLIWARLVGDLSGKPVFFFTHGSVWGFKPQADDLSLADFAKRLYGYSGVAARRFIRDGDGYKVRQKFWAFYRDPISDAITDQIPNPYTGRTDTAKPLSGPEAVKSFDLGADAGGAMPYAMRVRRLGGSAIIETSAFHRFKPADATWYKLEGNLENYVCRAADLDRGQPHLPCFYSQNLVAEWQTWTGMHGTPGHILFKGNGEPLRSLDTVPADQREAIERFFPGTLTNWR